MMKITKDEYFTIPNLMGYFRVLLIPVFAWRYLTAQSTSQFLAAAAIIGLSGLTDLFDGKIARKFNQVTELGKLLDPLADKLTLGAVIFCLSSRYEWMAALVILFIVKEGFMGVMGLLTLRHNGRKLDGAFWYGKVCTAVLYGVCLLYTSTTVLSPSPLVSNLPVMSFSSMEGIHILRMGSSGFSQSIKDK